MVFEMDFLFRNSLKSREIKNDKHLIQMYQKHSHVTNLKSALSDALIVILIKGWDKWSLMGHPMTKSSPYGSDYLIKKYMLIMTVRHSLVSPRSPVHWALIDRQRAVLFGYTTIKLSDGTDSIIRSSPLSKQLFVLYRLNDSQFCCKNYTTKCQFLTLVKHFYLSGVNEFDEFRAKTAQNWQFVKKSKKYEIIN